MLPKSYFLVFTFLFTLPHASYQPSSTILLSLLFFFFEALNFDNEMFFFPFFEGRGWGGATSLSFGSPKSLPLIPYPHVPLSPLGCVGNFLNKRGVYTFSPAEGHVISET